LITPRLFNQKIAWNILSFFSNLPLAKSVTARPLGSPLIKESGKINPWSVGEGVDIVEVSSEGGDELLVSPATLVG